jgi:YHS domain-containing protein
MFKGTLAALFLGMALCLSSIATADEKDAKKELSNPDAGKCPVSHKAITAGVTAEANGKTYGFCCEKCAAKFKENPDKFLAKKEEKKEAK